MNSRRIPKELMTPYQRWEMASFEEDGQEIDTHDEPLPEPVVPPTISVEELAAIRDQAHAEAYEEGMKQGHTAGYSAGARAAFEAGTGQNAEVLQQLREVAIGFTTQVAASGESIASQLLDLALDIAKAMLKTALLIRPELVLPIVESAMHALPGLQLPATLNLHPADADLVREKIGEDLIASGWLIAASEDIERGSCRIESNTNQIDASSTTRWRRVAASLSKENDWLA